MTFISNIVAMQTKSLHIQFVVDTVSFVLLCVFILAFMTKLKFVCIFHLPLFALLSFCFS